MSKLRVSSYDALRAALAAFPRTDWVVDEQPDYDDSGPVGMYPAGIIVPSTAEAIAGGADDFEELGSLHPDAAQLLAVEAVRAAPRMLGTLALATEFTVSVLPDGHDDRRHYSIKVTRRASQVDWWAVAWNGQCLAIDGTWDDDQIPAVGQDEWFAAHRFDLDTALRLAHEAAPGIEVNGIPAADVAARIGAKGE